MAFRLSLRILQAAWKPLKRAGCATGRGISGFLQAGWPGLTLGSLGVTFGFFGYLGAFLRTGLWRPLDVLLALVLAALGVSLTALVMLLLRLAFRSWSPRFLYWGLGSFLFGTGFLAAMSGAGGIGFRMMATLLALLGGFGLGLTVALRRRLHWAHRLVGGALVGATLFGSVALVQWLRSPGADPNLETQLAAAGPAVPPLALPDPSLRGPYRVQTLTYGSGSDRRRPEYAAAVAFKSEPVDATPFLKNHKGFQEKVRRWYWGFGKDAFPLNGRVWYPEGPGPFPLVLCVHGNHTAQDFSDPGYAYLGELLASRGFIFVSVDENFLNGSWEGGIGKENAVRGWMLLKHLEAWRRWNTQPGHPFEGRVDLDRIGLIGHSRGGEAVAIAAAYNRLARWPEDATQAFHFGFGIRAVIAIAPIDGQYETSDVPTPLRDVDYLVLQGSHDADVSFFAGQRTYHRVAFTDGLPHFKATLHVHRANHGQFNSVWGAFDHGEPTKHFLAPGALLPAAEQRKVAEVALSACLEASLKDQRGYTAFFRDPRAGAAWLPKTILQSQYQDPSFRPLATFEEDIDPCTASLPGAGLSGEDLTVWKERVVKGRGGEFSFRHKGLWLGWDRESRPASKPTYTLALAEGWKPEGDRLVLTLADTDDNPMPEGDAKRGEAAKNAPKKDEKAKTQGKEKAPKAKDAVDFTVELVGRDGRVAALPLSAFRPLQPVLKVRLTKWDAFEQEAYKAAWEPVFQTFELPLDRFRTAQTGFAPGALKAIRLRFDRTPKGVILLDQIGTAQGQ